MKALSAKDFATATDYPLRMIKRLCREGILPHDKIGRGYLIDYDMGCAALKERMLLSVKSENIGTISPVKDAKTPFLEKLKMI